MTDQPTAPQTWDTMPDDPDAIPFPIVVGWNQHGKHTGTIRSQREMTHVVSKYDTPAWWMPWPTFAPDPRTDHRLATDVGGHPVIPLPVRWRMGGHGDPIAEFDHIVLHLHRDGSVTWQDELAAAMLAHVGGTVEGE